MMLLATVKEAVADAEAEISQEEVCSEPRLAFNRTVVLRYRIHLEQRGYAPATINLRLAAVRRVAYEAILKAFHQDPSCRRNRSH